MPKELILTLRDRQRHTQQQEVVKVARYTIGRAPENDLPLDDQSIALRHAVIEWGEWGAQIANSDPQAVTYVNGQQITQATPLQAGNVVTLGAAAYDLLVKFGESEAGNETAALRYEFNSDGPPPASSLGGQQWARLLATSVLSLVALCVIYLLAQKQTSPLPSIATPSPLASVASMPTYTAASAETPDGQEQQRLEATARQVLNCIGTELQSLVFKNDEEPNEIRQRLNFYRQAPQAPRVAQALTDVQQQREALIKQAHAQAMNENLVCYLVLTELIAGTKQLSPTAVAAELLPRLRSYLSNWGDDAQNALISLAALKLEPAKLKQLDNVLRNLPRQYEQHTFWYLRQLGALDIQASQFVVDFLALSIIAQAPDQWLASEAALSKVNPLSCAAP